MEKLEKMETHRQGHAEEVSLGHKDKGDGRRVGLRSKDHSYSDSKSFVASISRRSDWEKTGGFREARS